MRAFPLLLLLAGCATTGAPPPSLNPPPPSPPPIESGLARVLGQDARALEALFGRAALDLKEGRRASCNIAGRPARSTSIFIRARATARRA